MLKSLKKQAANTSGVKSQTLKNESSQKNPKDARKTRVTQAHKRQLARKRQISFLQRQKDKGLVRKHIWIKLPKDKLRKFDKWLTAQDPDALYNLVERGSPHDLKCLWENRKELDNCI